MFSAAKLTSSLLVSLLLAAPMAPSSAAARPSAARAAQVETSKPTGGIGEDTLVSELNEAAKAHHIAIVAEGPLPNNAAVFGGSNSLSSANKTLPRGLADIASKYGYDVSKVDSVWILTKTYSDGKDIPAITPGESLDFLKDVIGVFESYSPGTSKLDYQIDPGTLVTGLVAGLSPAQLRELQSSGLPVSSLSAGERDIAWKFALYFYDQRGLDAARQAYGALQHANMAEIGEGKFEGKYALFGYQEGTTHFHPFTQYIIVKSDGSVAAPGYPPFSDGDPGPSQQGTQQPGVTTIGEEADALDKQGTHILVAADLRPKPVVIVGGDYVKPLQIVRAMAAVYGLSAQGGRDGSFRLMRRPVNPPTSIINLPDAVWNALPQPLVRAILKVPPRTAPSQDELKNRGATQPETTKPLEGDTAIPGDLHKHALVVLHADVDRYLALHKGASMATLSSLSENDRDAFALTLMTDFLTRMLEEYDHPAPFYITSFDQLVLRGGPYAVDGKPGTSRLALSFALPKGSSGYIAGPGIYGVPWLAIPQQQANSLSATRK